MKGGGGMNKGEQLSMKHRDLKERSPREGVFVPKCRRERLVQKERCDHQVTRTSLSAIGARTVSRPRRWQMGVSGSAVQMRIASPRHLGGPRGLTTTPHARPRFGPRFGR